MMNMVEPVGVEYCDFITIKGKQDKAKLKIPFILRGLTRNKYNYEPSQSCANIVTHSHSKLALKGPEPSSPKLEQYKGKTLAISSSKGAKLVTNVATTSYSILDQLQ